MRILRLGDIDHERPAVMTSQTEAVFVDHLIADWSRESLSAGAFDVVRSSDLSSQDRVLISAYRVGSPIRRGSKLICIGLNYTKHAAEAGLPAPAEPVIFMKSPDTLVGPNDDIRIPPTSTATDYEVELAVVIGRRCLYLDSADQAPEHILGYSISQDVSERHWQNERGGQWVKGKSFPTFNPMGPCITDEVDPDDLRLWSHVDGESRQDSRTSDMIFGVNHLVWYVSQVMELFPGDVINTGTPEGVGFGFSPPEYLHAGATVTAGIEGIGQITSRCI